jgi:biopolymer transport protein ExbD
VAGEVVQREAKGKKHGLRRPKRRVAIRIDMTPMVDIAFLLLIFYMVTTVFSMPKAMEINLPPKEDQNKKIEVKESNLLTLRVDGDSRFWWNLKTATPENLPLLLPSAKNKPDTVAYQLNPDTLRNLLKDLNQANPKLNTLILISRKAKYNDMVSILDQIDLLERSWNDYTAKQMGVKVDDLPSDKKFSYRYAIGDWEDRDDKIIADAVTAAQNRGEL